jgi:O-antigen ligase
MIEPASQALSPPALRTLSRLSLCALAISVSLGVALVSLSKVLLVLTGALLWLQGRLSATSPNLFFGVLAGSRIFGPPDSREPPLSQGPDLPSPAPLAKPAQTLESSQTDQAALQFESVWLIYAALAWMTLTLLWSDVSTPVWTTAFLRHTRLLVLPLALYCLREREDVLAVLRALVITQLVIVVISCLLWLGVPVPLHNPVYPLSFGLVINGHLEQPIMSTLMLVVLWHLRHELFPRVKPIWIYLACALTVANVLFVMTGRTGFIAMIVAVTLMWVKHRPSGHGQRLIWVILTPLLLSLTLGLVSPRFSARISDAVHDVELYAQGNDATSQGYRLDYWHQSIKSVAQAPFLGHGMGSWREEYIRLGGNEPNPPTNPHEQFLLWWVEGGLIGLGLMVLVFWALWRDSHWLEIPAQNAMQATWAITLMVSLFNCPFYGAGMGEFFLLIFACLMALGKIAFSGARTPGSLGSPMVSPPELSLSGSPALGWIERLGLMVVTQPLSQKVPGNERNYQQTEGLRKLGHRQLRKLVYLQLHSQRQLLHERANPSWRRGLWIYERTAQIGDSLMDLAPRSLFKEHGLEVDLLTLAHLAPLFEFDPCFGQVLTDARLAQRKHYDFVIVQSVHHRALIKKIKYFHDLPWLCIQGYYDVPDFSRMRWSTQRLMDLFDWHPTEEPPNPEPYFERHARQKLWLPPAPNLETFPPPHSHPLVLSLGGVDPVRTYHRWPELLMKLSHLGFRNCLLIGKGDVAEQSAREIMSCMRERLEVDNQVNCTSVMECAQILSSTHLLITADGGMMHLAISSGTQHIISLFTQGIAPEYRLPKDLLDQALQSVDQNLNRITPQEITQKILELSQYKSLQYLTDPADPADPGFKATDSHSKTQTDSLAI